MKVFQKIAGAFLLMIILAVSCGVSLADYQFDDLIGNGKSYQWMIINDVGDTVGDSHSVAIDISGDVVTGSNAVIDVLNGKTTSAINSRHLRTLFLVLSDGYGEFDMNFRSPTMYFDVATPNLQLSNIVDEEGTDYVYADTKTSLGHPGGNYDGLWRKYHFAIGRRNRDISTLDTVAQYFYFQQVPGTTPSQGVMRPVVIANVGSGTAADYPLRVRFILRDSNGMNGNIVAHDYTTWNVTGAKSIGENHWVFVPVDDLVNINNSRINYYLTTEVANYTAIRYAVYDADNSWGFPYFWKFDFPRYQGNSFIENNFQLNELSHIAPGLVSVFRRQFNVNETNKRPLQIHPADDISDTSVQNLRLDHKIIFGERLGETYKDPASEGGFNQVEVTAFYPNIATFDFFSRVANIMNSTKTVDIPRYTMFQTSSISTNLLPSAAVRGASFTINHNIPGAFRTNTKEGMLPIHITFNIPVTLINDRNFYNSLVRQWHSGADIAELFANTYHIYGLVNTDGEANPWDITQELLEKGYYNELVKVFIDEDRGRATQDNDRGLITVSFIAMLMDGARDNRNLPALQIIPDHASNSDNDYIVIRDGNFDNKWNMTFFIAPSEYINNPSNQTNPTRNTSTDASSSGGGCNSGMIFAALALLFFKRGGK